MFTTKFEDLIDKKTFFNHKYFFLASDYKYTWDVEEDFTNVDVDYELDFIEKFEGLDYKDLIKERDSDFKKIKKTHKLVKLDYYDDELIPAINKFYEKYKENFISEVENRNIFESSGLENFSKKYLKYLDKIKLDINNANHLIDKVKNEANISIDEIYHFVSNDFYQNYFQIPQKIPFNLNKNQVVVLFHQLYENGIISDSEIKPTDLFRLIEQNFKFYDKESNSYTEIKRARDLDIRLYKQDEEPNPEPSLKHLQSIFMNPKFYDY